ncbi:MAG: M48 family metallopeptidase [Myxococcota bacterium]|nr:M48 family metallopeptidase [Myxococcota bacterium]
MWKRCWGRAAGGAALALLVAGCGTLSVPEERSLGEELRREVHAELRFVGDRVVNDYVSRIGQELVAAAGPQPFEYHFYVVEDDDLNAFAMPAGHVYIHTGILLRARNVSELAGVIGHEVGHVALRHVAENYNRQRSAGLFQSALVLAGGLLAGQGGAAAANVVGGLGTLAVVNSFTREAEAEADAFAVEVMPRAGYDPLGIVTFFETLRRESGARPPEFLSSHPAPENRMEAARARIATEGLPAGLRLTDGGRLEIIQRRVRLLTGRAGSAPPRGRPEDA